jgi:membrane fusion protein
MNTIGTERTMKESSGQEKDLFPTRMPLWVPLMLGLLLILIVSAGVVGAILVPVSDTIRCPFVLVPEGGSDPVRSSAEGALAMILASHTQEVRKGQELFVIRSREVQNLTTELRTLEQDLHACRKRATLLADAHQTAVEIQKAKIGQYEKDLAYQQEEVTVLKDFLMRLEQLGGEGLVPRVDILSQRMAASKAEHDLVSTRQSREMADLDLVRMQTEYSRQVAELHLEQEKFTVREAALRRQLRDCEEDVIRVRAPFDGTVVRVEKRNLGDVVSYGQELCRIARSDAPLVGELSPPEDGISRLRAGQKVQLFFTAFPYERFGTGLGTVRWISPAAVASQDGDKFVVFMTLDSPPMNAQGQACALRAGMKGEARVVVGRRTAIEYFFDPVRRLREDWRKAK